MDIVDIKPAMLKGEVRIPPSKSVAHKALIAAFLSGGKCNIENIDLSDDISATIRCIETMGAKCKYNKKTKSLTVVCEKLKSTSRRVTLDCSESSSSLGFFIPIVSALGFKCNFIRKGELAQRPIEPYIKVFEEKNIKYELKEGILATEGKLTSGEYIIDGSVSPQLITGLLFALPLLTDDSKIVIKSDSVSKGYMDLTLQILEDFGITVENDNYKTFSIKGNQKYSPTDYCVEGDFSQAAFFLTAGAIGGRVVCSGMNPSSVQADKQFLDILKAAGAVVSIDNDGKISAEYTQNMHGITVDASEIPNLVPIMAVLFSFCRGESRILNIGRLRFKEIDHLRAISSELRHLGVDITEGTDYLKINGRYVLEGKTVSSWGDHHIAMAMAIAACRCEGNVGITNAQTAVEKSYPNFFEDYKHLGGQVTVLK